MFVKSELKFITIWSTSYFNLEKVGTLSKSRIDKKACVLKFTFV